MRTTVEREAKLIPGGGFRLAAFGPELPTREFVSTYVDTADLRLARHGVTLRHRLEAGAGVWQLKLPRGTARVELEEPGPPARPPQAMLDLLPAIVRGAPLVRVARLRTRRRRVRVEGAEIVEDTVSVLDGARVVERFRELEVELTADDNAVLERLVVQLVRAGAEQAPLVPKLYRALGIEPARPRVSMAVHAPPLEVLRVALVEQAERLLVHDPGTRLGSDPEDLHQMRVATRRARAFLRAARPLLEREWARSLREELGWLGSALGPARDLDVLLAHVRADLTEVGLGERVARSLLNALEEEHAAARAAAVSALSHPRYFALLYRLESTQPAAVSGVELTLSDLWREEFERTRRRFRTLGPRSSDDELHAGRIQVKRARYAAELAEPELGKRGRRFVAAAKRLQDVLGEHQDACVAEERVRAWATREPGAEALAERLVERQRARRREARAAWPAAWAELERRGRRASR